MYVIYFPITPVKKLDAAEHARTVSAPARQAGGMGLTRVAQAVLRGSECLDWCDHSRVDR